MIGIRGFNKSEDHGNSYNHTNSGEMVSLSSISSISGIANGSNANSVDDQNINLRNVNNNNENLENIPNESSTKSVRNFSWKKRILSVFLFILFAGVLLSIPFVLGHFSKKNVVVVPTTEVFQGTSQVRFILDLNEQNVILTSLLQVVDQAYAEKINSNLYEEGNITIDPKIINIENGEVLDLPMDVEKLEEKKYAISTPIEYNELFKPGEYRFEVDVEDEGTKTTYQQDFKWGVLAINTTKSVYTPGETAKIHLAVLDETGEMVCDAYVTLKIFSPDGNETLLSTDDNSIVAGDNCSKKEYVPTPDYETKYQVGEESGPYYMSLTAITENGAYTIHDSFEVVDYVPLDVERYTATRIFPPAHYPVKIIIKANEDFTGRITETVPKDFEIISNYEGEVVREFFNPNTEDGLVQRAEFFPVVNSAEIVEGDKYKTINWDVRINKDDEYQIEYVYKAPEISPEFYTLGPLEFTNRDREVVFEEYRKWQIAADAIAYVTYASTSSRNTTSLSPSITGTSGNLLVFFCGKTSNAAWTGPGGTWSTVYTETGTPSLASWYKVSDGTADTPSCSWSGNDDAAAIIVEYSGTETTQAYVLDTNNSASGSGDATSECPSVTPSSGNHVYVAGVVVDNNNKPIINTYTNSFTERIQERQTAGPGADSITMAVADVISTGTQSTVATSAATVAWRCHTIAFNEEADAWTGTVYTDDDEVSTITSQSVCGVVDNGTPLCTTTDGSGVFTLFGLDATAGQQITFYLDGGVNFGNTVTISDGGDIVSGDNLRIYEDHVVVRHEQGTDISIVDMDAYDNDQNATDMLYDAEATPTLDVETPYELFVQSGYTFAPSGNITSSHDIEIDGTWTAAASETIDLSGTFKLDSGGTFTPSTSTVTFDGTTGTEDLITAGTGTLYNLIINDGGNSLTVQIEDPLVVDNDLTITGGTLDVVSGENNQLNVGGSWDNDDTFLAQNGTVIMDRDTATTVTIDADGTGTDAFYDLTFNDAAGGATYQLTTLLDVDRHFTLTGGTVDSNGNNITVGGNWTNDDTFTEGTATVTLDGTLAVNLDSGCADATTCTNENFYNLTINKSSNELVTLTNTDLRTTNTLTITTGQLIQGALDIQAEGATAIDIAIGGRWTNISTGDVTLGGSVANEGLIRLDGNGLACDQADDIVINSTAAAQRSWTGNGAFKIVDVNVQYQAGTATIRASSSTNSGNMGANWSFIDCNIVELQGLEAEGLLFD